MDDRTPHTRRDDEGSALVMAIVVVTVIALAMAAALSYADTTMRAASKSYVPTRDRFYAADMAMKATVAYVRANPSAGRSDDGGGCKPAVTFGSVRGDAVTTQVCPQGADSLTTAGGGDRWGLITLATGSEKGLEVSGKTGLQVNGNVRVNSSISVANQSELKVVGGDVQAAGSCSGTVSVDGVVTPCTITPAPGVDPGYDLGLTTAPAPGTGSCDTATKVATLTAGTWTESTLDDAIGSCDVVWMQTGIHYLQDVDWTIKNKVVVGDLDVAPTALATTDIGKACTRGANGGVLLMGGTTSITLSGSTASLEVCGKTFAQSSVGSDVPLTLFGLAADTTPTAVALSGATSNGTSTSWSNPSRALAVDGLQFATYSLAKNATSKVLDLRGFGGSTSIPENVTTVTADVTAKATAATTFTLTVRDGAGTTNVCTQPSAASLSTTLTKVTVSLTCTAPLVPPLTVQLTAKAPKSPNTSRTVSVDGIALSYDPPAVKALSCSSACVSTSGNNNFMYLDGEVYLPTAKLSVQLPNQSTSFTTLGIVARVLQLQVPTSAVEVPVVAIENGSLNPGDVTIATSVGSTTWMTCHVEFSVSGASVSGSSVKGCTVPF